MNISARRSPRLALRRTLFRCWGASAAVAIGTIVPANLPAQNAPLPGSAYDVIDYDVSLDLDFDRTEIVGVETLRLKSLRDGLTQCALNAVDITIDSVSVDGAPVPHASAAGLVTITLPRPAANGAEVSIALRYHGRPTSGLRFNGDQAFTAFDTDRWLVCDSDPSDKALLTLRLTVPDTLMVVASGDFLAREPVSVGKARHTWRSNVPYSTYLYGFAVGRFNDTTVVDGSRRYRYVGTAGADELARVFRVTPHVFRYFEQRAGIALPDTLYIQALVRGSVEQEVTTMALLRDSYANEVLNDPREDWLIVHEAAHQWWGNMLTCATWSEFWLNEGFATFMTAAFKEHYWGREEYERETAMARVRYERMRAQGRNRPLTFTDWTTPQQANSPIAYFKGAAVLHYLRFVLGEETFWKGIKIYTRSQFGGAVTALNLREAFESAGAGDLKRFFREWVESTEAPELSATHEIVGKEVVIRITQRRPKPFELTIGVAVETSQGRRSQRVMFDRSSTTVRFPLSGDLLSVRIDDGGHLPTSILHERSADMLRYQMLREPDVAGRVDAILAAESRAAGDPTVAEKLKQAMETVASTDSSRLVRQVAAQISSRIGGGR